MVKAIHSGAHRFSPEKTININKELNKKAATIFNQIVTAFLLLISSKKQRPVGKFTLVFLYTLPSQSLAYFLFS